MPNKIFKSLYLLLGLALAVSFFNLKKLPDKSAIDSRLFQEPFQASSTRLSDFSFDYKKKNYSVKPIADYELWGLVVSVNDIGAWYNMYHDKDDVNLKDICVIWGDNLKSDAYKKVSYKSGEWTCYYSWFGDIGGIFQGKQLSNNHLFSGSEAARKTIRDMNVGDQIHLLGALSEYAQTGSDQWRKTSLTRNDTGNGACETVYVSQAEIIKKRIPDWKSFYEWSKIILASVLLLHLFSEYREARRAAKTAKS